MRVSFITTVLNEEKTVGKLLNSLDLQKVKPNEVIIVDGGSTDNTLSIISNFQFPISGKKIDVNVLVRKGNRSLGRNEAIKNSKGEVIVCSDAGCTLHKDWIKNILKPFKDESIDVVSGYYKGKSKNFFEKCLIPYALVMEDKINPDYFLPATRSMAFRKKIWEKIGGFDERLSHNEDFAFSTKLKKNNVKMSFAKNAIVYWKPRANIKEAFIMFFRFALGDSESGVFRSKVILLFARYFLILYFLFISILEKSLLGILLIIIFFFIYVSWSIKKSYKYVNDKKAIIILPCLQFTADLAVMLGTITGLLKRVFSFNYAKYIKQNKFLFLILFSYIAIIILTLKWGIPNQNHPFPYHMDEWHQLHAVVTTFKEGTPNTEGSANGTMLHFILSGIYLVPFVFFRIVDSSGLKIEDFVMRERLFEILRISTLVWGILSILVLSKITQFLKIGRKITLFLFVFTPIWLMLSGYFKYDIALMFWILLSFLFILRYWKDPSNRNYLIAAFPSSLAFAVKVSALPLLIIYAASYFWFNPNWKENIKYFILGIAVFICSAILFGIPDTLFGNGNIYKFLYENLISSPMTTQNFNLGMNQYFYLFFHHYPIIFGYGLVLFFIFSCFFWLYLFLSSRIRKSINLFRMELFVFFSLFIFMISLLPLGIYGGGNRSLVLLPFTVLICALAWPRMITRARLRNIARIIVLIVIIIQLSTSFFWIHLRASQSPQEVSSEWILNNIPQNQIIGLENVPIYQNIPNILEKEFYFDQYRMGRQNRFKYEIVDSGTKVFPSIIVITNDDISNKVLKNSPKNNLVKKITNAGYTKIATFTPDFKYHLINDKDFYFSWLVAVPNEISVYKK